MRLPSPRLLGFVASLALFAAIWQLGAAMADSRSLPSPSAVATVLLREAMNGNLAYHLGATLGRVAAAFLVAYAIGAAIGVALGRSRRLDILFDPWLVFFLNLPALVTIALFYVWFGLTEAAALAAVAANKVPTVAVVLREGARALDRQYFEVARVNRFSRADLLFHVVLPQLQPYLAAAARSGLALIWKIVLVVELLGRSSGVGFQIHLFFQVFDVAGILAYALSFIAVVQFIELAVLQPAERRAARWRPAPSRA
ncbi:ABC transporter permease [Arenibaculum pallidiluteum]|uniref:ABC transporter permease n=1 Tax=Arenibaculum pallidiluteum TaxID=2812559 RepID=UPI001A958B1B|nr:ABC transporter permease [Arenibaculum pallidiluteum]